MQVQVNEQTLEVSNLDKVFWPDEGFSKADVLNYYTQVSVYLLPHLQDRPIVLVRYPDGIKGKHFYQKECPKYAPQWVPTVSIEHSNKEVNYCLCNNLQTLLWMINQGSIEIHPWLSRYNNSNNPDYMVFDLDPAPLSPFRDVIFLALRLKAALEEFGLQGFLKTSGASGLHIYVPIKAIYPYSLITKAAGYLSNMVAEAYPKQATVERLVKNRKDLIYLDYLQNGRGKTIVSVYCLRPRPKAPVSIPITWEEISRNGAIDNFFPVDFNIQTTLDRLKETGDLFAQVLSLKQDLGELLRMINSKLH